jgi:hypothetical protein
VRREVLIVASMNIVFWVFAPCNVVCLTDVPEMLAASIIVTTNQKSVISG